MGHLCSYLYQGHYLFLNFAYFFFYRYASLRYTRLLDMCCKMCPTLTSLKVKFVEVETTETRYITIWWHVRCNIFFILSVLSYNDFEISLTRVERHHSNMFSLLTLCNQSASFWLWWRQKRHLCKPSFITNKQKNRRRWRKGDCKPSCCWRD